jgi:spermidine synthase
MATTHPVAAAQPRTFSLALFTVTLFVSAALLFLLEPLFAKMTLPVLGGTSAVWTTCMLFYQAMLLAGYAYANAVTRRVPFRAQAILCAGLALAPLLILPFSLPVGRVPPVEHNPIPWLLMILTFVVGLPFFVLSIVAPTLQKWFAGIGHPLSNDPYFLYAASNLGSMLGLLSYPIFIEPHFRLAEQSRLWAYGYAMLVLLIIACAAALWRAPRPQTPAGSAATRGDKATSAPPFRERLCWLALAFVPSSLMLGVTTVLTTEIPPIPMFWVLPLAIYLLSFILVFAKKPLISHQQMAGVMPLLILAVAIPVLLKADWPLFLEIAVNLMTLFVVAVACHGELARRRPSPEHLTGFYLWLALGGVLGGLFNAILAPLLFSTVLEFPLALFFAALLRQIILPAAKRPRFNWLDVALPVAIGALAIVLMRLLGKFGIEPGVAFHLIAFGPSVLLCLSTAKRPIRFALAFAALVMAGTFYTGVYRTVLHTERSFYGIYRIANDETGQYRILFDGQTLHGMQSLVPDRSREPLSYYTRSGPIGQVFATFAGSEIRNSVAIVGLGGGSLACYATPGEQFTFYEIDPVVERIARDPRYFTFLQDCAPTARIILGDARISLKNNFGRSYGIFILDAFGADAIPIHLLTREAVQLYLSKLADHGILAFHISNRYLDLQKVLGNIARDAGLVALVEYDTSDIQAGKLPSRWVVMARTKDDLGTLIGDPRWIPLKDDPQTRVWTDDYSSILTIFNWD